MLLKKGFNFFLIVIFVLFSAWLMYKSFGYNQNSNSFYIARHQVGDFGLHLTLMRSFSWGRNFPPESPFFPGKPLPYHYYLDFIVGILERAGLRIDIALNSLSIFTFTLLLFLIYKLPQRIFGESKLLGLISVLLFVFPSNLTFIDFLKNQELNFSIFSKFWFLPDYINKGPFDGSVISIFFTLNPYLNQRHLIFGVAIVLATLYILIPHLLYSKKISSYTLLLVGIILALTSRIHILMFLSCLVILFLLGILFKKYKSILLIFIPILIISPFHAIEILSQNITHPFLNPGFLASKPLTAQIFLNFWFLNLGIALLLIPIAVFLANSMQKKLFLSFLSLFLIGNIFQLSFRIEHNHSLFNLFIILANFYVASLIVKLYKRKVLINKLAFFLSLFLLTISGLVNLMAVKNDFRYPVVLNAEDPFLKWVGENSTSHDIFLSKEEILDPITFAGRKNYLGHRYYLEVMGYDFRARQILVNSFFEVQDRETLGKMRKENIKFMVIPKKETVDFHYKINTPFLSKNLLVVYEDSNVIVFKL